MPHDYVNDLICVLYEKRDKNRGGGRENLLVDLLQEGDLLLQRLDASLQVQTGQSGSVHVLQRSVNQVINWGFFDTFYREMVKYTLLMSCKLVL